MIVVPRFENLLETLDALHRMEADSRGADAPVMKVAVLRNAAVESIDPFLRRRFLEVGSKCILQFGGYGTALQDLEATAFAEDDVILLWWVADFIPDVDRMTSRDQARLLLDPARRALEQGRAWVVVPTLLPPLVTRDRWLAEGAPGSKDAGIREVNEAIRSLAAEHPGRVMVVDTERLVMQLGADACLDARQCYLSKAPFRAAFLDALSTRIAVLGRGLAGQTKKCVVLDCDHTLWGGVIGEDGLGGIQLDPHTYPGNVFHAFQAGLIALQKRGVLLALCSKNNPQDVWEVLDQHPHCLLRQEHFAASRINWEDKSANLGSLLQELNLGAQSLVFVDDSDAECARIKAQWPEVSVRQVPRALSELPDLLFREGLFEGLGGTPEDARRTELYRQETNRREAAGAIGSVEEHLRSLRQVATIHPLRLDEIPRAAQLTQKTNQFNLTTRRYTEGQMASWHQDPNAAVFTLHVRDRFGDAGLTGLLIAFKEKETVRIDTLLLSCRILQRRLEEAFVSRCFDALAEAWHPVRWEAEYLPTPKNEQVEEFWERFGFGVLERVEGATRYSTDSPCRIRPDCVRVQEEAPHA